MQPMNNLTIVPVSPHFIPIIQLSVLLRIFLVLFGRDPGLDTERCNQQSVLKITNFVLKCIVLCGKFGNKECFWCKNVSQMPIAARTMLYTLNFK